MDLTKREKEVLNLLVNECLTETEIAKRLVISRVTARTHINSIYQKLNIWGNEGKNRRAVLAKMFISSSLPQVLEL